jgi:small subunit ribosomal protein S2
MEQEVTQELALEMVNNGVLYGHKKTKTHPKMKRHIGANRSEVELIKPESVLSSVKRTASFLKECVKGKQIVLVVSTKPSSELVMKEFAEEFGFPIVTTRWLGGTITNYPIIKERVKYYLELKRKRESGELEKYTKKERVDFDKEISKLEEKFEGLVRLSRVPDAIFVVDTENKSHRTAIREAMGKGIEIAGIIDTDDNPDHLTHPIFANDHARASVRWIMEMVKKLMKEEDKEDESNSDKEVKEDVPIKEKIEDDETTKKGEDEVKKETKKNEQVDKKIKEKVGELKDNK